MPRGSRQVRRRDQGCRRQLSLVDFRYRTRLDSKLDRYDDVFSLHARHRDQTREVEMSLADYLEACRDDPGCYASPAERMLQAIGEPEMGDTSRDQALPEQDDPRLSRVFRIPRNGRHYRAHSELFPSRSPGP